MRAANTYRAARREADKASVKMQRKMGMRRRGGTETIRYGWAPDVIHSQNREAARRLRQMEARRG